MADAPLSGPERDLASLAAQHRPDRFLQDLADLAASELPSVVGVLANGMVIIGTLAPPEAIAAEVDVERARLADVAAAHPPEGKSDEDWERDRSTFATANQTSVENFREVDAALEEEVRVASGEGGFDLATADASLARKVIFFRARSHLTLRDVQIVAPGQPGMMRLGIVRIAISQVTAWWPVHLDESGSASFQLFGTD